MPEYPDLTVYVEAISRKVLGAALERIRILHPFVLRTVDPSHREVEGKLVTGVRRIGKRIVIALEAELFLVIHLMIAGRLRWESPRSGVPRKIGLAAFDFGGPNPGTLLLTEAGTKKRVSLHIVRGRSSLDRFDRGLEIDETTQGEFVATLKKENHTLKRSLTDPRIVAGIGNAYSDEILHRARLSPFKQTAGLSEQEATRLFEACLSVLHEWTDRFRKEVGFGFPTKVTAFRREMAVHGKYGQPCPVCGTPVQRIAYADNECNYCPSCQTGGKLLADRALSRLLKGDWPSTLTELEEMKSAGRLNVEDE